MQSMRLLGAVLALPALQGMSKLAFELLLPSLDRLVVDAFARGWVRGVNPSMYTVSVADSPAAPPRATPLYGRPLDSRGHPDIP